MPDEVLASRLLDAISAMTRIGGEEERTSIVPGILVVDSAPNDLPSGYIKIQNPRDGTYVPCLLVSGLVVADNDFVNVLFTKGTEPIALSQSPGSPSSGVKVSEVWESDFGAVAGSADADGNWTWQADVILDGGDLTFTGVGQINATGGIGFDGNGAGTFNALIIDANDDVIVNNSQGGADFLVRGDGATSLFFVDVANELVTVNESGEDVDFRVESDNDANAFFVQGSNGFIGIGTGTPSLGKIEIVDSYSDTTPHSTIDARAVWSPASTSGSVFPTAMFLFPKYDSTHTPAGGFLTAFRTFVEIEDSGVISTRNVDILSINDGAGTVADMKDIVIRAVTNSGGGAITTYTAINISASTAAGTNRGLIQEGSGMINGFAGTLGVGITASLQGQAHIDQPSTTGAKPVLYLDQADLSEEFFEFASTVGAGNPIDTAAIGTYYGKIRVSVAGVGFKFMPLHNS